MLSIIEYGKDSYEFPALLVLGCFDAIHAGHRELLKKAKLQAKINGLDLGVMMFRDGKNGKLLYSFEERAALLEQFNVKFVLAVDFNDEFKKISALDFLHTVEENINVKAYMSGKDFRFGAQAKGKSSTLKNYAEDEENGVWYMSVKDVDFKGEKISTTLIKSCLDAGDVAKANELLGTEFSISGEVVKGEGRGTSVVGFPTVNIFYPEWKHPLKHGVYAVKSVIDGTEYQGIANFGNCPTFGDERVCLEVYFEGFSGDLYGRVLTVQFISFIRDIEEFNSAEELNEQLQNDLTAITEETVFADADLLVEEVCETENEQEVVAEVVEEQTTEEVIEEQPVEEVLEEANEEQPAEEMLEEVVEEEPADEVFEEVAEEQLVEEVAEEIIEELPIEETMDGLDGLDENIEEIYTEGEETVSEVVEEVLEEVVEEQSAEAVLDEVVEEQPADEVFEEVAEEQLVEEVAEEIIEELPVEETMDSLDGFDENIEELYTEGEETVSDVVEEVFEEANEDQPAEEVLEDVVEEEQPVVEVLEDGIDEQPAEEVIETADGNGEDEID